MPGLLDNKWLILPQAKISRLYILAPSLTEIVNPCPNPNKEDRFQWATIVSWRNIPITLKMAGRGF